MQFPSQSITLLDAPLDLIAHLEFKHSFPSGRGLDMPTLPLTDLGHTLFATARDGYFIFDPTSAAVVDANPAACRLIGMTAAQVRGISLLDLIHSDSTSQRQNLRQACQKPTSWTGPAGYYFHPLSDIRMAVHLTIQPIVVDGETLGLLGAWASDRDPVINPGETVSDNQLVTLSGIAQLQQTAKHYRDLVETSHNLIWSVDAEGRWTFLNRNATRDIYGCEPEEMLGRPFYELLAPEQIAKERAVFERILAGESVFQYETIHYRKDGAPVDLSFNAIVLRDENGQVLGTTGTAIDITQRKRTETALREREALFEAFMNHASAVAFMKDAEGRTRYINRAYEINFQVTAQNQLGKTDFELWPPEVARRLRANDLAVLEGGKPVELLEQLPTPDGRLRDWWVLKFPIRHQSGQVFLGGFAVDLTEHRRTAEALRSSEERYRQLFERNLAGVFRSTLDGRLLDCNDSFVRILGYGSRAEILTHPTTDFYMDTVDRAVLLARLEDDPHLTNFEFRMRRRDGSPLWILENVSLLADSAGEPILEGTIVDISERKNAEQALRDSEAKYRSLIDNLEQAVFLKDRAGFFRAANPNFCANLGLVEADLLGKTDHDFFPPELAAKYRTDDLEVMTAGTVLRREEKTLIGGRLRTVRVIKTPVRDQVGEILGVLGIFWDVTDQLDLEAQLRQAQKMEAVGQLAGGIAHDFNNLLTVILGNLSFIRQRPHEPELAAELITNAEQAGLRAAELTKRLLGFSRRTLLRIAPLDLNHLVEETIRILRRTIDPRIQMDATLPAGLGNARGDAGQVSQILMNLAINARDAMPQGGRLHFSTSRFSPNAAYLASHVEARTGEFIRLRVEDTGTGMAPEVRERIFEPFFTTKEVGKGTGLGLAMVFGILQQHEGWVTCASEPGRGTTFDIFLPREPQTLPEPPPDNPALIKGHETILLVDDEALIRNLGALALRRHGFQVMLAEHGLHALDIYRQHGHKIDLVILDGTMPQFSGRDTLLEMTKINPSVKVLFSSGYAAEHHRLADQPHVVGYLAKPYQVEDLAAKVRETLDQCRWK